MTNLDLIRPHR